MAENLERLKSNLISGDSIWDIAFEKEEDNSIHLVLRRKYEDRIILKLKKEYINDVYCSFGVHIYDTGRIEKSKIVINSVLFDKSCNEYKLYQPVFKTRYLIPIDLEFDEYFTIQYPEMTIKKNGKMKKRILDEAYYKHIQTTYFIRGFLKRLKLFCIKQILWKIPEVLLLPLRIVLFFTTGTKVMKNTLDIYFNDLYGKEREEESDVYFIEFMSIKVKGFSAFTYSLLHLVLAFVYIKMSWHNIFISKIVNNVFLGLTYVVVTLTLWERYIPNIVSILIKKLSKKSYKIQSRNIKI